MAVLALMALAAGIVSDFTDGRFWNRHSVLANLTASIIVVMLSGAIVNEVIARRSRQRWSILAQYVMFELVRNARMIWSGFLDVAGLLPGEMSHPDSVDAAARVVRDTPRLTAAVHKVVVDEDGRDRLHAEVAFLAQHSDEVLGRWAAVMLNAASYAEIIDRHVELASDVAWIGGVLDTSRPPKDVRRQKRARSSPAVQIEGDLDDEQLTDRIVVITQLAERLDRGTFDVARLIVPAQWWRDRLGITAPSGADRDPSSYAPRGLTSRTPGSRKA